MTNEPQTLSLASKPTGGSLTLTLNVVISFPWYIRLLCWLREKPTSKTVTIAFQLPFDATKADIDEAIEKLAAQARTDR